MIYFISVWITGFILCMIYAWQDYRKLTQRVSWTRGEVIELWATPFIMGLFPVLGLILGIKLVSGMIEESAWWNKEFKRT